LQGVREFPNFCLGVREQKKVGNRCPRPLLSCKCVFRGKEDGLRKEKGKERKKTPLKRFDWKISIKKKIQIAWTYSDVTFIPFFPDQGKKLFRLVWPNLNVREKERECVCMFNKAFSITRKKRNCLLNFQSL